MNNFFDYIFYRVYKQYEKWGEDYPYPFAEGVVVVVQGFIILSFFTIFSFFVKVPKATENEKVIWVIATIIIYIVNHNRYKKKYLDILSTYNNTNDPNKKRNGFLIIVLIIVVILFPMVIGYLRNNLGYDI